MKRVESLYIKYAALFTIMVAVAQLVEHWIVVPVVAGSSPVGHPIFYGRKFMAGPISSKAKVLKKVLANVKRNGECLEYMGSRMANNYGRVKIGGRNGKFVLVHRFVYEELKGPIENRCVCHTCDNPPCINPDHLFLGTHEDNMKDMAKKDRAFKTIGEKSGMCKLTEKQIEAIRKDSRKQIDIAREYGLSKSHVSMIINYKTRIHG